LSLPFDPRALEAARVGFFGGTFDPPHTGHLFVAREAARARGLEHVVWVPARQSPHKAGGATPGRVRVELVRLALADAGTADTSSIWEGELERAAPSYTVDSVRDLAAQRRAAGHEGGLFLVLGGDQLLGIERWHMLGAILALAEPIVLARSGAGPELVERLLTCAASGELELEHAQRLADALIDPGRVDVAATELRERLGRGGDVSSDDLTPSVVARVAELGLYR
jgi:nicotinate-nucleotide adenylyltransferase